MYPDSTFELTREYDLSWTDYGFYEIKNSRLKLKFKLEFSLPVTMSLKDTLVRIDTVIHERDFLIDSKNLYYLNSNGTKVRWLRNNFFDTNLSWLTLGYHRLRYKKLKATNIT